jgi:hypothetical protein
MRARTLALISPAWEREQIQAVLPRLKQEAQKAWRPLTPLSRLAPRP